MSIIYQRTGSINSISIVYSSDVCTCYLIHILCHILFFIYLNSNKLQRRIAFTIYRSEKFSRQPIGSFLLKEVVLKTKANNQEQDTYVTANMRAVKTKTCTWCTNKPPENTSRTPALTLDTPSSSTLPTTPCPTLWCLNSHCMHVLFDTISEGNTISA